MIQVHHQFPCTDARFKRTYTRRDLLSALLLSQQLLLLLELESLRR